MNLPVRVRRGAPPALRWLAMLFGLAVVVGVALVAAQVYSEHLRAGPTASAPVPDDGDGPGRVPPPPVLPPPGVPEPDRDREASDRVAGIVLRPDGSPAVGAEVTLYRALSPWPEWRREVVEAPVTTARGEFQFRTQRGPDLLVGFRHADHAGDLVEAPPAVARLVLRLQHGFVVSGHVVAEPGRRVGNCRVILEPTVGDARRAIGVDTGPDGQFRFDNVPGGSVRVVARHPWWQPAVLPLVTVGASRGLELRLTRAPLSLEGRVVTAASPPRPVAGARVRALPNVNYRDLFEPQEAVTDSQGAFRLAGMGQGNLRIEVRHPEWSTTGRSVAVSASTPPLTFELLPRSQVRGVLQGLAAAAAGAPVQLLLRSTAGEQERCQVRGDGSFAFVGTFSSGNATLEVMDGAVAFARTSGADVLVRIEEGGRTELELDVLPPSTVRGRILDSAGRPLAEAQLLVSQEYQRLPAPDRVLAVTDGAGRFQIRGLAARAITLHVRHDRHAGRRIELQVPGPGGELAVPDVTLSRGGSITGAVLRGSDPLPGALVLASGSGTSGTAVSLADGTFLITDLAPGSYRVRARYSTMPLAFSDSPVQVVPDEVAPPVELRFAAGRTVGGVVQGRTGQPVEGAFVSVRGLAGSGAPIVTDAAGSFAIEVPPRDVELLVVAGDGSAQVVQPVPNESAEATVTLDVPPMATITARVHGLPGRRMLGTVLLRLQPLAADGVRARPRMIELTGGVLRHPFAPAQPCRIVIQCEGYVPFVVERRDLTPGGETDLGDILLEPGASLRVAVHDEAGLPVAGAAVFLGDETDLRDHLPQTRTGPDGTAEISGVSAATPTLVVACQGYAAQVVPLRLPQDVLASKPRRIALRRGTRIEVAVPGGEGQAVLLLRDGVAMAVAEVDESGVAVFRHRSPGDYQVHLFAAPERRVSLRVLATDEVKQAELR